MAYTLHNTFRIFPSFDLQRDQFIGGRRGSGNMTDLYADAERICLEVLNSIPYILSDVNMFSKTQCTNKTGYSNSIGTPGNSNTNTPVMLNKKGFKRYYR